MKGIVLAAGSGTRLYPITRGISKQLMPIYDKPMIYYPLSTLIEAGINHILIITTPHDQQAFKNLLGDGSQLGCTFEYAVQEKPRGLADAYIVGEDFIADDKVTMILGDNIFYGSQMDDMLKKSLDMDGAVGFAVTHSRRSKLTPSTLISSAISGGPMVSMWPSIYSTTHSISNGQFRSRKRLYLIKIRPIRCSKT